MQRKRNENETETKRKRVLGQIKRRYHCTLLKPEWESVGSHSLVKGPGEAKYVLV